MGTDSTRNTVAKAAGLSEVHGGPSKPANVALRYQVECDVEQGLVLSIERIWSTDGSTPPTDMFIVCPVCGEEHTLARST